MKKLIITIIAAAAAATAFASCPPLQPYGCTPGYNGKMICGCGVR